MKNGKDSQKKPTNNTALIKNDITVDTGSGSMSYNRLEMQVSQTLHMAIEFFDNLDYLLVLDYYDDITLFENESNPEIVSYYQMKTNEESISISTAIREDWLTKLYAQLERPEWIVKELGLITNCPLKVSVSMKGENGKNKRETKSYTAEKTAFNQFNPITIEEIKKDIANKKGIRKEDIDLSKFVHMRTILSIPSHKEIVEQEMGTFLHKKYPKITMDSVKTIFNTMIDLLTRRQNECERLLQESPQFTELQREDHELLDEYPFLNMITDSNGVTKALDLNYAETEALARFCLVEDDINCWKRLQMYLLGIAHAMEIIELLKLD